MSQRGLVSVFCQFPWVFDAGPPAFSTTTVDNVTIFKEGFEKVNTDRNLSDQRPGHCRIMEDFEQMLKSDPEFVSDCRNHLAGNQSLRRKGFDRL